MTSIQQQPARSQPDDFEYYTSHVQGNGKWFSARFGAMADGLKYHQGPCLSHDGRVQVQGGHAQGHDEQLRIQGQFSSHGRFRVQTGATFETMADDLGGHRGQPEVPPGTGFQIMVATASARRPMFKAMVDNFGTVLLRIMADFEYKGAVFKGMVIVRAMVEEFGYN